MDEHVQSYDGETKHLDLARMTARAGVVIDDMPFRQGFLNKSADSDWKTIVNDVRGRQGVPPTIPPALVPVTDFNGQNGFPVSSDISVDLLDQQQSKEQAKLLQRFKQLKEWQKQQQEKLIRQQREQLHVLQSEQQRVKSILTAQRHKQWGGGINVLSPGKQKPGASKLNSSISPSHGLSPSTGLIPPMLNSNDSLSHGVSSYTVPPMLSSSVSPSNGVSFSHTMQPHVMQNLLQTLPRPRENPSNDLDSTGEAPNSDTEDGFYPLPETSSEISQQDAEDRRRITQYDEKIDYDNDNDHLDTSIQNYYDVQTGEKEENVSNVIDDFDNQPVSGKGKHFEELLEQQLMLEAEQNEMYNSKPPPVETKPKRTFLKRGQGISRFGMKKFHLKKKTKDESMVEKTSGKQAGKDGSKPTKKNRSKSDDAQLPQVSRKIAVKPAPVVRKPPIPSNKLVLKPEPKPTVNRAISKSTVISSQTGEISRATAQAHRKDGEQMTSKDVKKDILLDDTMEVSFQNKVRNWQVRIEEEKDDLDEFELLEQAADDNVSFSSNASLVVKVMKRASLKNQRLIEKSQKELMDVRNSRDPRAPAIDVSPDEITQHPIGTGYQVSDQYSETERRSSKERMEVNEWNGGDATRRKGGTPTEEDDSDTLEDDDDESEMSDFSPKMKRFSAGQNRDLTQMDRDEEEEEEEDTPKKMATSSHGLDVDFDDDESWGEFAAEESSSDDESITAGPPVIGANIATNIKDLPDEGSFQQQRQSSLQNDANNQESAPSTALHYNSGLHGETSNHGSAPSTAELASKLFPTIMKHTTEEQIHQQAQLQQVQAIPLGQGVQSRLLRDKLSELETEIERFRTENTALAQLRSEREKDLDLLKNEIATFEKQKNEELKSLEEFKADETKKLKKERRNFEKYQQAMKTMPDKKGREEIERLKDELSELQEELSSKERRWTASSARLRKRVEVLETENTELRDEIKVLEQKRLESLKQDNVKKKVKKKKSDVDSRLSFQSLPEVYLPSTQDVGASEHTVSTQPGITTNEQWQQEVDLEDDGKDGKSSHDIKSIKEDILSSHDRQIPREHVTPVAKERLHSRDHQPRPSDSGVSHGQQSDAMKDKGDGRISEDGRMSEEENSIQHPDGKVEHVNKDGSRVILFKNGTRKDISTDGETITVTFFNGDIKQVLPDQRVVYYYQETQTTHTTYQDGLEILQFSNNQTEKHYPDGTKEITFPDQTIKYLFPNGREESIFGDGTVLRMEQNGDKVMEFANGQREVHTSQYKKREYPDGTVKTVYPDGRQETRYSTGRIRVKDKDGKVVVDQRT